METWKESQLKQLTFAKSVDTAYPILLRFAENLGFNFCAVTVAMPQQVTSPNTLQINNYPEQWNTQYEQKKFISIDPVVAHCNHSLMPIVWDETLYAKAPHVWQALQQQGLQHGWSQSFHHKESGLCSILSLARKHCPISPLELYEHFGYIFYAASHLSELFARTLPKQSIRPDQPHLSPRELEVLQLSAGGKTAYEISKILSLSERTVNYHVQNVIEKLNVCNKISAVIAAARAGII